MSINNISPAGLRKTASHLWARDVVLEAVSTDQAEISAEA